MLSAIGTVTADGYSLLQEDSNTWELSLDFHKTYTDIGTDTNELLSLIYADKPYNSDDEKAVKSLIQGDNKLYLEKNKIRYVIKIIESIKPEQRMEVIVKNASQVQESMNTGNVINIIKQSHAQVKQECHGSI